MPRPPKANPERLYAGSLKLRVSKTQLVETLDAYGYTGPTGYSKSALATILGVLCAGGKIEDDE